MRRVEKGLEWWARVIFKHGDKLALAIVVLSIFSGYAMINNLGVNARTADMFSPDLPFRQERERLSESFPRLQDLLIVVIEFGSPEINRLAAEKLANRLREEPELFDEVFYYGEGDFFTRHGLLYYKTGELERQLNRIAEAQPFLSELLRDPSLRGFFQRLTDVFSHDVDMDVEGLPRFLGELEKSIDSLLRNEPRMLSWQLLMQEEEEEEAIHRQILLVKPHLDYSRILPAGQAIQELRRHSDAVVEEMPIPGKIRLTGDVAMSYEEMRDAREGAINASILAFIAVTILLGLGLRSFRLIAASVITLLCGLLLTAGFAAIAVGNLNMISLAFAVLYIGLGVDFAIHLCMHYRNFLFEGEYPDVALTRTIRKTGVALALCSLSTAVGFYVFFFTDFQGVSELGIIAGSGMVISLIVSLTLIPAFLKRFPVSVAPRKNKYLLPSAIKKSLRAPEEHSSLIRVSSISLGALALFAGLRVPFDHDPLNLRNPESESVSTLSDLLENGQVSPYTVEILVSDPEEAAELSRRLKGIDTVDRVVWLEEFIPKNQEEKLEQIFLMEMILGGIFIDQQNTGADPPTPEENMNALKEFAGSLESHGDLENPVERDLLETVNALLDRLSELPERKRAEMLNDLRDRVLFTFRFAMDDLEMSLTADRVESDQLPEPLVQRWKNEEGEYRLQVFPKPEIRSTKDLREFAHVVKDIAPRATGDLVVMTRSGEVVVSAFRQAFSYALVAIILLLLLYTRSIKDTSLILFPLLLAGAFTFGTLHLLGGSLNFANIIALPLLLGYGVNNGIHVVHRARSLMPGEAFLETSTAHAVFYSSLTTLSSFGMLSFSQHPGTAGMGLVLTLGLLYTLLATLIALPAFLKSKTNGSAAGNF